MRGIYEKKEMQKDLEDFAKDSDAKAVFWNHQYNQAQMLDTVDQIQHAHATMVKQGYDETRIAIFDGYPILIQYNSQGGSPLVDPLCLGFCFAVTGLALICKPQCWHCQTTLKLKKLEKATEMKEIMNDRVPLLTCYTLSSLVEGEKNTCK